ncbi:MAG: hypothetical protein D6762_06040 [Candidatus Neomarinimicrobiota bacterium]|nr:MAG: hypothetical protein D6762_06040 [Candidatus Neomarinimicrobiota bacterium]
MHRCGRVSGRDTDKVRAFDIPLEESVRIGCPTIATAYAAYECVLRHRYPVGDHDWFVGEVVAIHADDEATREGLLDPDQVDFPLYLGRNTYLTTDSATRIVLPDDPDRLRE